MSRRLAALTLDNLGDLPDPCRRCVVWELDPVAARRATEAGDTAFEKEAWVSATLLQWGSCGRVAYVDDDPAGFVLYAPPALVPRSVAFPTSPVSPDAVLLMTLRVLPTYSGGGLARMLVQSVAKDLTRRGVRAIEAFGLAFPSSAVTAPGQPGEAGGPGDRTAGLAAGGTGRRPAVVPEPPIQPPPATGGGEQVPGEGPAIDSEALERELLETSLVEGFGPGMSVSPTVSSGTRSRFLAENLSSSCMIPADLLLAVGFKTVRPHHRYPRLRLELKTALSWREDVELAIERILGSVRTSALTSLPT